MRYWFGIFGERTKELTKTFRNLAISEEVKQKEFIHRNWALFVNETLKAHVPSAPVSLYNGEIIFMLHGLPFPNNTELDDFIDNYKLHLKKIVDRNIKDLNKIPLEFDNGNFVGAIIFPKKGYLFLFNSFLNHRPLYYFQLNENLIFSTSLTLIAQFKKKFGIGLNKEGVSEYLILGTNVSKNTLIRDVYCLQKFSFLKFSKQKTSTGTYYQFPKNEIKMSYHDFVDETNHQWNLALSKLTSKKFNIGLGITGGIDSRFILAGWPDKTNIKLFTGTHKDSIDYLNAKILCEDLGISENHKLEDYNNEKDDKIVDSFFHALVNFDNPLFLTSMAFDLQNQWRRKNKIDIQLNGVGGDYLGGVHYYHNRNTILGLLALSLPFHYTKFSAMDKRKYLFLSLRNHIYFDMVKYLKFPFSMVMFDSVFFQINNYLDSFMNASVHKQNYLERLRSVYKIPNLNLYNALGAYDYFENISPYLSLNFLDYTFKIPLHLRNDHKLVFDILTKYQPKFVNTVLNSTIFTPKTPHIVYKTLVPIFKGLGYFGIYVPNKRIRKNSATCSKLNISNKDEIKKFIVNIINSSSFLHKTNVFTNDIYNNILDFDRNNTSRKIWRLFMLAIAEKKLFNEYTDFYSLLDKYRR